MTVTSTVRTARRAAGVRQRDLALRTGIAESSLSQIERGHRVASTETADRILAGLGVRLVAYRSRAGDVADAARGISDRLSAGNAPGAVRRFVQLADDLDHAPAEERYLLSLTEPSTTGAETWDAALAALVQHRLEALSLPAPSWTDAPERFLSQEWILSGGPYVVPVDADEAPPAFRRRGVLIDPSFLESV
ncbi:helix-turn-helix domain-containing protein [Arenivirga flava]|uniref:HTH cro/C1-type domain-containing protein n=1 Tax=Arenivirga flava TaxID=1930060 RepID=A0AA37UI59_9MICO|nr:helix-turn-helix transcriptional regulator [Arenivirga flava]GMA27410.1 hypothetical protein GCM10025874_06630 [Arenivirga flava]